MLPPVFYVQQLEQILLRKLLSPPTPAARPLRPRAARLYPYSVFSFAFFVSSRVHWSRASALRAAVFSCTPRPSFPPHLRLYPYSVFCSLFSCRAASIDLARLRCAPDALPSIFSFCQPFPFQAAPLWLRACHIPFSRFSVFLDPYFRRFYDFFLRRKYLESLVGVIRPFGVRPRATKAKKFSGLTFSSAGL